MKLLGIIKHFKRKATYELMLRFRGHTPLEEEKIRISTEQSYWSR